MKSRRLRRATWWSAAILALSSVVYPLAVRPWHQRWGATQEEVARRMAGDDDVKRPIEVTTRAVTVAARPEHIWPWLMQLGNRRGGLYSYDWIDLIIGPLQSASVDHVLPQFQDLQLAERVIKIRWIRSPPLGFALTQRPNLHPLFHEKVRALFHCHVPGV